MDPTHTRWMPGPRGGREPLGSDVLQTVRAAAVNACSLYPCAA